MNARATTSRTEKLERVLAMGPPKPWSGRSSFALACFAVAVIGGTFLLVSSLSVPTEPALRWFSRAFTLLWVSLFLSKLGEALYAGVLGERFGGRGRTLRVVAYLATLPANFLVFVTTGYVLAGTAGAVVGGTANVLLYVVGLLHEWRRRRARAGGRAVRSGSR